MVDYSLVAAVFALIIVAVLAYKIVNSLLKALALVAAVAAIAMGVIALLAVMDFNDFRESFSAEKNLFLIAENGNVLVALELQGNRTGAVNQQETDEYSRLLREGNYAAIREGYYKLLILHSGLFGEEEVKGVGNALPERLRAEKYPEERAKLAAPVVEKIFSDTLFLVVQHKKGNIEVYEETAMFKVLKLTPSALASSAAGRLLGKAKNAVVDKIER